MTPEVGLGIGAERFAVTGATGLLGRAFVEFLAQALGPSALDQRLRAFASRPRKMQLSGGAEIDVLSLDELPACPHDVLIHFAFATREHAATLGVDRYVALNAGITTRVLAAIEAQRPGVVCYASSGAVYCLPGAGDLAADPYGELKRLDEHALRGVTAMLGARLVVARVFNVAGPWVAKPGFAMVDMIRQVAAGGPLQIHSQHAVRRSYIDAADLAAVVFAAACQPHGPAEIVFDTAGEPIEMADLAQRVCNVLGATVEITRTWDPEAPADDYLGDAEVCDALFARFGLQRRTLDEQIARTVEFVAPAVAVSSAN